MLSAKELIDKKINEGQKQPGVRDGSGPYAGKIGKRKQAGEKCPNEKTVEEGYWLPKDLKNRSLVSQVGKQIKWDVGEAYSFVVALLEDVNAHSEAKAVNDLLVKMMG